MFSLLNGAAVRIGPAEANVSYRAMEASATQHNTHKNSCPADLTTGAGVKRRSIAECSRTLS